MDISKIIEGWRNHLIPPAKLKKEIERVSKERLAICEKCGYHSKFHKTFRPDAHCTQCLCTLSAKTKCLSCSCELPEPKWGAVASQEVDDEIQQAI